MGLGFSHGKASWAYSGFNRFRTKLAKEIGIDLDKMIGFPEGIISWTTVDDDIARLLNHSDCGGELFPEECAKIAPRLKELVAGWNDDDYDKREALQLIEGMEECIENNESLEFL